MSYAVFTENPDSTDGKRYAVYNPSCRMLDLDPFDQSIVQFVEKQRSTSCASKPPLTSVSQVSRSHILHLHEENFHHYSSDGSPIGCMYDLIRKEGIEKVSSIYDVDNTYRIDHQMPLDGDVTFIEDAEFVRVQCFLKGDVKKRVYVNMHAFVGFKEEVGRKISRNLENPSEPRKMGVMIVGFDSMSRSSILRNMPKTVRHLKRMGWFALKGYNKIEENTFPNVMAILTGKTVRQIKDTCWISQFTRLDDCPMIWKNFSEEGYITAYAEDSPGISTFNCMKVGFFRTPTDYYLRPFLRAAENFIRDGSCLGLAKPSHHIFNYSIDFASCFHRHPTFSLFWLNSFSHNDGNEASTMDDDVVSYFERLADTGILNTSMVIFLSDHGLRVGPLRETYVGHMEDRLPFIYIWLPDWFKNAYPEKVWSLVVNTNALTSPYDIYMTLVDILGENTTAQGCPGCQSLFKQVPWNRSCSDAGITEHWCACNEYEDMSTDSPWARKLAESVVDEINGIIFAYSGCTKLTLKKILSLRQRTFGVSPDKPYIVAVQTTPGDAKFEVTAVRIKSKDDLNSEVKNWKVLDRVSRINSFGSQSYCITNYIVREYCFCPDFRNPMRTSLKQDAIEIKYIWGRPLNLDF